MQLLGLGFSAPLSFHIEAYFDFNDDCKVKNVRALVTVPTQVAGQPVNLQTVGGLLVNPPCIPAFC
jgi:hypothetical protein